jgi:hypothetical protein
VEGDVRGWHAAADAALEASRRPVRLGRATEALLAAVGLLPAEALLGGAIAGLLRAVSLLRRRLHLPIALRLTVLLLTLLRLTVLRLTLLLLTLLRLTLRGLPVLGPILRLPAVRLPAVLRLLTIGLTRPSGGLGHYRILTCRKHVDASG